jgi:hypothetical protein
MFSGPKVSYSAVPIAVSTLSYSIFTSKNEEPPSFVDENEPRSLGNFKVLSLEVFFHLFDEMDFGSLGKLSNVSSVFAKRVQAYFSSGKGMKRLNIKGFHKSTKDSRTFDLIHGLALYLKRSSCLVPTKDRLNTFYKIAAQLDCFKEWRAGESCTRHICHGLSYLGE